MLNNVEICLQGEYKIITRMASIVVLFERKSELYGEEIGTSDCTRF
jgi:hypothetical protein